MSYIWENYSVEKEYRIGEKLCPYIEALDQYSAIIDVNPLLRFAAVFDAVFSDEQEETCAFDTLCEHIGKEGSKQFVNVLFHFLANLDRTKGLDSTQQVMEKLRDEIRRGMWGSAVQSRFEGLTDRDKECILFVLSERVLNDEQSYFMEAVAKAFPVSSLCYEKKTDLYYLYIGSERTDYNIKKLEVIKILFWTINRKLETVWDQHYGIIGCDDTMHIDGIRIV